MALLKLTLEASNLLFLIILSTFMILPQTLLVTQFLLFRWLGLYDTHTGLILLNSFSVFGTFMLCQFYLGISNELIESARMDGARHFRIFSIYWLPLVRSAIATYAILRFIWTWNDFQNPLIFFRSKELYIIQLGVQVLWISMGAFTH